MRVGPSLSRMADSLKLSEILIYRGISAKFWRNLHKVGDASTRQVMVTPYCGKGEPNQCIRVGHASLCAYLKILMSLVEIGMKNYFQDLVKIIKAALSPKRRVFYLVFRRIIGLRSF